MRLVESLKTKQFIVTFLKNDTFLLLYLSNQIYCSKNIHLNSLNSSRGGGGYGISVYMYVFAIHSLYTRKQCGELLRFVASVCASRWENLRLDTEVGLELTLNFVERHSYERLHCVSISFNEYNIFI